MHASFVDALRSAAPRAELADKLKLYGWLIGDWIFDARVSRADGVEHRGEGEIHFAWALDGRAIQDVWILPGLFYGTTLRVYDPQIDAWHILWSDPVKQYYTRQIGRAQGKDIVQLGQSEGGLHTRWSFLEIARDSFLWRGEVSGDAGKNWTVQSEYRARRAA